MPGNKNTTYFSNCCLFPLQSIGIINKLPIKKKLCVEEKQVRVPRELGLCQSVARGSGGGWSLLLTTRGMGPFGDSSTLEDVVISQFLTRDLSQGEDCASRGLKA